MKTSLALAALPLLAACATSPATAPVPARTAPLVDYHQHLVSPAFAPIVKLPERDGAALVRELDAAGIERAVVLSVGYSFADERKKLDDPDRLTREENDWTSAQVAGNSPRLIGFCSANPLRPVALQELERCLGLPGMVGVKLHFGNAGVSLRDPAHLARMLEVFALAQRLRAPVLVHMRARGGSNYGAEDAQIFLDKVVPTAPDVEIVVAHLGASGPGYPAQNDEVMAVFAAAAERKDQRMANLYFDVATNVTDEITPAHAALVAQRIRQVGLLRVLYGSDLSPPGGSIGKGWEIFRSKVPLTTEEFQQIANNRTRFSQQVGGMNVAPKAKRSDLKQATGKRSSRLIDQQDWREETLARMRTLILEADPKMTEERKWKKPSNGMAGVPVWSHNGIVCTGETYAKVVKLTFARGASLPDPSRLFNSSLEGNTRRAIDIREGEKVDARAFKALVKAAVAENG